ncbi:MAG: choline/ethanolamine kinase family protein [Pseudomonadales bacterium]
MLTLENALATWPQWNKRLETEPSVCCELSGGLSNQTFLLDAGSCQLVLRLGLAGAELLGADRYREQKILFAASDAGLAPAVVYAEPDSGLLVTEFLDGITPDQALLGRPQWQAALLRTMNAMRALSLDLPSFPYRQQMQAYWQQLLAGGHLELEQQYQSAISALDLLHQSASPVSLVHHDLHPENLLMVGDRLMFLDWEYAGWGYAVMDDIALLRLGVSLPCKYPEEQLMAAQSIAGFLDNAWYLLR